jgi:hypothetical protein
MTKPLIFSLIKDKYLLSAGVLEGEKARLASQQGSTALSALTTKRLKREPVARCHGR